MSRCQGVKVRVIGVQDGGVPESRTEACRTGAWPSSKEILAWEQGRCGRRAAGMVGTHREMVIAAPPAASHCY